MIDWLMPVLLGGAVHFLSEIKKEISLLQQTLAFNAALIDGHERRIQELERRDRMGVSPRTP